MKSYRRAHVKKIDELLEENEELKWKIRILQDKLDTAQAEIYDLRNPAPPNGLDLLISAAKNMNDNEVHSSYPSSSYQEFYLKYNEYRQAMKENKPKDYTTKALDLLKQMTNKDS